MIACGCSHTGKLVCISVNTSMGLSKIKLLFLLWSLVYTVDALLRSRIAGDNRTITLRADGTALEGDQVGSFNASFKPSVHAVEAQKQ